MIPDMWSRLWANSFLLRRPQYFAVHTYEGRRNTPLRGEWDLDDGLIHVGLPNGGSLRLNNDFSMERRSSPYYMQARLGDGWYARERLAHSAKLWNWTSGDATLQLENPQRRPLRIVCRFAVRSLVARDLQLWVGNRRLRTVAITTDLESVRVPEITIDPGLTLLRLHSSLPPTQLPAGDIRPLGFAAYGIDIEVLPDSEKPSA